MTKLIIFLMTTIISASGFAQPGASKCSGCDELNINLFSGPTNAPSRLELTRQATVKEIVSQLISERVKLTASWWRCRTSNVSPNDILTVDQIGMETNERIFSKDDLDRLAQFLITSLTPFVS